jgi:hypothetical protein
MMQDVEVVGKYAYAVVKAGGLYVFDVSDPTAPVEIGSHIMTGWTWVVVISGNLAYIATDMGLHVVDVSDPAFPTEVGYYDTGHAWGVTVADGYIYVAGHEGLLVLKVTSFGE